MVAASRQAANSKLISLSLSRRELSLYLKVFACFRLRDFANDKKRAACAICISLGRPNYSRLETCALELAPPRFLGQLGGGGDEGVEVEIAALFANGNTRRAADASGESGALPVSQSVSQSAQIDLESESPLASGSPTCATCPDDRLQPVANWPVADEQAAN